MRAVGSILLVDDDPDKLRVLEELIRELERETDAKVEILKAEALSEALVLAEQHRPENVLVDMNLPETFEKFESLDAMRKALPDARVAVHSGHYRLDDIKWSCYSGASAFIPKKVTTPRLKELLRKVFFVGENDFDGNEFDAPPPRPGFLTDARLRLLEFASRNPGQETKVLAKMMGCTASTLNKYRDDLVKGFGLPEGSRSIPACVAAAVRRDLIRPYQPL
jgi:CheY-like chemotaxis protein